MLKHFILVLLALIFMEGCVERGMVTNLPEQSIEHYNIMDGKSTFDRAASGSSQKSVEPPMKSQVVVDFFKDDSTQNTISGIMVFLIALAFIV